MPSKAQVLRKACSHRRDRNAMPSIQIRTILLSGLVLVGCTTGTASHDPSQGSDAGAGHAGSSPMQAGGALASGGENAGGALVSAGAGQGGATSGNAGSGPEGGGGMKMFPP